MLENLLKLLDKWNSRKKIIEQKKKTIFIKERDIVFINMGQNIGVEQAGKLGVIWKKDFEILHYKFISCIRPQEVVTPHKSEEVKS